MAAAPGPIRRAWYQWKMMRFPWRKKWLVGFDLQGNTFWEFKDAPHALRKRRIAKYHRRTHYGDVQVSPPWMQWLRHTRYDPPSVADQRLDVQRQERIKILAAQADATWAAQPSALDAPDKQQPVQMLQSRDPDRGAVQMDMAQTPPPPRPARHRGQPQSLPEPATPDAVAREKWRKQPQDSKDSPWNQAWQPQGGSPAPAKPRA